MTQDLLPVESPEEDAEELRKSSPEALDCELSLLDLEQAVLAVAGREFVGPTALGEGRRHELRKLTLDPQGYGSLLFECLFPHGGELHAGYQEALTLARHEGRRLRLRLHFAPTVQRQLSELHWELLLDPRQRIALGRSRSTALCRYLSVPLAPGTAVVERPKVLAVVAAPSDCDAYGLPRIDGDATRQVLEATFRALAPQVSYEILAGPATPVRIRDRLVAGSFHVLHLQAHGTINSATGTSHLILETQEGRAGPVEESLVAEIVEGDRELRLVTLMTCHGGTRAGADPFSGLAPALVRRGVASVVAIRGAIRTDVAAPFTAHLYRHLARWGRIDAAVNEARQQLHLAAPESPDWGLPVLFMRLEDGLLWRNAGDSGSRSTVDWKRRIAKARSDRDIARLEALERELATLEPTGGEAAMDLYLSYRALESWENMIRLYDRLPRPMRRSVKVREQLAFALNRQGEHQQAIWILEELLGETGPSHETCGLLGRVYKDLWQKARRRGRGALASGYLDKAIATYVQGFEIDWRDAYAGINALTLLDLKADDASLERQAELVPLVRFAVKKRLESSQPNYWDHATLLELSVLAGDPVAAERSCADALAAVEEAWQSASTANNLRMIRDGRRKRGIEEPWLDQLIEELARPLPEDT